MRLYKSKLTGITYRKVDHHTFICVHKGETNVIVGSQITVGEMDDLATGINFTIYSPFSDYYEALKRDKDY
jgi:hypothetical protein